MKRKQFQTLSNLLTVIAVNLGRQAEVMERSEARIQDQLLRHQKAEEERAEALRRMFPGTTVIPGAGPNDETLVLDTDGTLDPDKTKH